MPVADGGLGWGKLGMMPAPGQYTFESPQLARYEGGQHFLSHKVCVPGNKVLSTTSEVWFYFSNALQLLSHGDTVGTCLCQLQACRKFCTTCSRFCEMLKWLRPPAPFCLKASCLLLAFWRGASSEFTIPFTDNESEAIAQHAQKACSSKFHLPTFLLNAS